MFASARPTKGIIKLISLMEIPHLMSKTLSLVRKGEINRVWKMAQSHDFIQCIESIHRRMMHGKGTYFVKLWTPPAMAGMSNTLT